MFYSNALLTSITRALVLAGITAATLALSGCATPTGAAFTTEAALATGQAQVYLRVWHDINGYGVAQSADLEAKVFTIKNIAAYALFAEAEGRFGLKAGNDGAWKVAT